VVLPLPGRMIASSSCSRWQRCRRGLGSSKARLWALLRLRVGFWLRGQWWLRSLQLLRSKLLLRNHLLLWSWQLLWGRQLLGNQLLLWSGQLLRGRWLRRCRLLWSPHRLRDRQLLGSQLLWSWQRLRLRLHRGRRGDFHELASILHWQLHRRLVRSQWWLHTSISQLCKHLLALLRVSSAGVLVHLWLDVVSCRLVWIEHRGWGISLVGDVGWVETTIHTGGVTLFTYYRQLSSSPE
jgi:hypothetical protein